MADCNNNNYDCGREMQQGRNLWESTPLLFILSRGQFISGRCQFGQFISDIVVLIREFINFSLMHPNWAAAAAVKRWRPPNIRTKLKHVPCVNITEIYRRKQSGLEQNVQ